MEHPVKDIRGVIQSLCQGTPEEQQDTVNRYYMPSASFVHPFCRVPSFEGVRVPVLGEVDSRMLVLVIYKWYKVLSPKIEIDIESSVFDQRANLLYVTASQTFSIWFLPFHRAPVRLVTVLTLTPEATDTNTASTNNTNADVNTNGNDHASKPADTTTSSTPLGEADDEPTFAEVASSSIDTSSAVDKSGTSTRRKANNATTRNNVDTQLSRSNPAPTSRRYRIAKQEDLYQVNEFLKFVLLGPGALAYAWFQLLSTFLCLLGVVFLGPLVKLVAAAGRNGAWNGNGTRRAMNASSGTGGRPRNL